MISYLLLVFINFQTKCRHSLHELTRIVRELVFDAVYIIEILALPFNTLNTVTQIKQHLSLLLRF